MARKPEPLRKLTPPKELWKIAVRVMDVWTVSHNDTEHLQGILKDEQGDTIHFVIPPKQMPCWMLTSLQENMTVEIQNFSLQKNDFPYKASNHPFKLVFNVKTTIKNVELPHIPPLEFHFQDFGDILNGKYQPDMLVDVIGAVHQIQHKHIEDHITHKRIGFTLKDESANVLHCTLWGDYALSFSNAFDERPDATPFIIILHNVRIQPQKGTYPLQLTNNWSTSKLIMNQQLTPISEFKTRFTDDQILELSTQTQSQLTPGSQLNDFERAVAKEPIKSLAEIKQLKQNTYCMTVATTVKIVINELGWCFNGCASCPKKPKPLGSGFLCNCKKYHDHTVPRYKVEIEAAHNKETYNFIFWDHDCQAIIGHSAQELINKLHEDGEQDPKAYPEQLDEMIYRTLVLSVMVQPRSRQCSVMKAWDNPEYVKIVQEHLASQETTSKLEKEKGSLCQEIISTSAATSESLNPLQKINTEIEIDSQTQSGMADHDPQNPLPITPAKRIAVHQGLDELTTPTLKTTQQSSTKATKNIKIEKM